MEWTFAGKAWELSPLGEFLVAASFIFAFVFFWVSWSKRTATDGIEKTQPATAEQPAKNSKPSAYLTAKEKAALRPPVPELDLIDCAKIAKQTIIHFDTSELLEIAHLIPQREIMKALADAHEKLHSLYEFNIKTHYKNLGVDVVHDQQLEPAIDKCMTYGMEGIVKLDAIQNLLPETSSLADYEREDSNSKTIKKGRNWRDISRDGDSGE